MGMKEAGVEILLAWNKIPLSTERRGILVSAARLDFILDSYPEVNRKNAKRRAVELNQTTTLSWGHAIDFVIDQIHKGNKYEIAGPGHVGQPPQNPPPGPTPERDSSPAPTMGELNG